VASIFSFKCARCGQVHEGSPSFAFRAPDPYIGLSESQKAETAQLSEDLCVITHAEGADRFVRGILEVPIHGTNEPFLWGVWVSLSEKSFSHYRQTFRSSGEGEGYFGWVSNQIALYPYSKNRAADVILQGARNRPKVLLRRAEAEDDQLVLDQINGISVARAQDLAERAMHGA
jgi:hypothetical protein